MLELNLVVHGHDHLGGTVFILTGPCRSELKAIDVFDFDRQMGGGGSVVEAGSHTGLRWMLEIPFNLYKAPVVPIIISPGGDDGLETPTSLNTFDAVQHGRRECAPLLMPNFVGSAEGGEPQQNGAF